jgi:23S rRNA (adenine2030-N6)-methyltransferase
LELKTDERALHQARFAGDRQVVVRRQDGYAGLKAYLPPKEKRGLVLIDPPYESDREYEQVVEGLKVAHDRWSSGIFALWYPIKDRPPIERFHRTLSAAGIRKMLLAEFAPYPEDSSFRLNGCGMVVVNPPWKLEERCDNLFTELLDRLRAASGRPRRVLAGRNRCLVKVP